MGSNDRKLLNNNITKTYKKVDENVKEKIDREAKKLSRKLNLSKNWNCCEDRLIYYIKRPER